MPIYVSTYPLKSPSVPRSITNMAREHHLGRRRIIYSNQFEIQSFIMIAFCTLPIGGVLLYFSIYMLTLIPSDTANEAGIIIVACFMLLIIVFLLLSCGLGTYRIYESIVYGWFVYVYDKGCIIQKRKEAAQPFSWNEIETIWQVFTDRRRNSPPVSESCTIQREDGYKVMLTRHGGHLNKVTEVINEHLREHLLPHLLAQYSMGQSVLFGPCGVNREGFTLSEKDSKLLPWSRFASVEIKGEFLLIHEQEQELPWASLLTATIPNLLVLTTLVDLVSDNPTSKFP